jgi:hypothetical protein
METEPMYEPINTGLESNLKLKKVDCLLEAIQELVHRQSESDDDFSIATIELLAKSRVLLSTI